MFARGDLKVLHVIAVSWREPTVLWQVNHSISPAFFLSQSHVNVQHTTKDVDGGIMYSEHFLAASQIFCRWSSTCICNRQQNNRFLTVKKQNIVFLKDHETVPEVFCAHLVTF